jgi:hypothetical protein
MSKDAYEEQREHETHMANLQANGQGMDRAPETLKYISEPEKIDSPSDGLEWLNSKAASTTNLSEEDVRSKEWVVEYFQLLARMELPPHYGLHGHRRAWAYGDIDEFKRPLTPDNKLDIEGFSELGKEASHRSKDGWGVQEATKDRKESVVRKDEANTSGGLLGRFRS